jgi:hypothetical protein
MTRGSPTGSPKPPLPARSGIRHPAGRPSSTQWARQVGVSGVPVRVAPGCYRRATRSEKHRDFKEIAPTPTLPGKASGPMKPRPARAGEARPGQPFSATPCGLNPGFDARRPRHASRSAAPARGGGSVRSGPPLPLKPSESCRFRGLRRSGASRGGVSSGSICSQRSWDGERQVDVATRFPCCQGFAAPGVHLLLPGQAINISTLRGKPALPHLRGYRRVRAVPDPGAHPSGPRGCTQAWPEVRAAPRPRRPAEAPYRAAGSHRALASGYRRPRRHKQELSGPNPHRPAHSASLTGLLQKDQRKGPSAGAVPPIDATEQALDTIACAAPRTP